MNRYIVKQITMSTDEERELPNVYGWDGAIARSKKWEAKMNLMHCDDSTEFANAYFALYNDKFEVEATDLEHVFKITNLWDEPDAVHTFEPGHSTSVGDLIEDTHDGSIYLVCAFGFKQVRWPRVQVQFTAA